MKKRPNKYDEDIIEKVVEALSQRCMKHQGTNDKKSICEDLKSVLMDCLDDDSYKTARMLDDDCYWSVDSELVDILENIMPLQYKYYESKIEKWVLENNIKPLYQVGDKVNVTSNNKPYKGEVIEIYKKNATYCVYVEKLGHIKKESGKGGTLGIVKSFEDVSKIEE